MYTSLILIIGSLTSVIDKTFCSTFNSCDKAQLDLFILQNLTTVLKRLAEQ